MTPLGLCRMMLEVLPECRLSVVYDDGSVIEKIGRCKMTSDFSLCYKGCNNDTCPPVFGNGMDFEGSSIQMS